MYYSEPQQWAEFVFGEANLGDPRRTKRLVQLSGDIAQNASSSLVKASGTSARIEAAYRFIRNDKVIPDDIAEAGFQRTSELIQQRPTVLAIQDTTGLTFKHSVTKELGEVSCSKNKSSKTRTLYAHSTLILDAQTEQTIGLANQHYWYRQTKVSGTREEQQKRDAKDKESYRWKSCFEELKARTGDISNVINVCDREADVYEYLAFHVENKHRFVVRSKENRCLESHKVRLHQVIQTMSEQCCYSVNVKQRGGRPGRQARMTVSYQQVSLKRPKRATGEKSIPVNVIVCQEKTPGTAEPLCWILYTSETIQNAEDALKIVRYYELRWRIEEFHKTWKSDGTEVEGLRLQHLDNLKRVVIIQAFVAVRLMQLQDLVQPASEGKQISCEVCTEPLTWKLLWKKVEQAPVPSSRPSLHWYYYAIARLGGWYDSKRNGRVGIKALWQGWHKLMVLIEAAEILQSIQQLSDL